MSSLGFFSSTANTFNIHYPGLLNTPADSLLLCLPIYTVIYLLYTRIETISSALGWAENWTTCILDHLRR